MISDIYMLISESRCSGGCEKREARHPGNGPNPGFAAAAGLTPEQGGQRAARAAETGQRLATQNAEAEQKREERAVSGPEEGTDRLRRAALHLARGERVAVEVHLDVAAHEGVVGNRGDGDLDAITGGDQPNVQRVLVHDIERETARGRVQA